MSHYIVLIHSRVERYSGYSYTKATVNNPAMNMGIQISLWDNYLIWLYIQRWDNGSHNSSLWNFLRNLYRNFFLWELHQYTSLPTVHKHSFFSTSSTRFVISYIIGTSHSNMEEVISLVLLICIPLWLLTMLIILSYTSWPSICLICEKTSIL